MTNKNTTSETTRPILSVLLPADMPDTIRGVLARLRNQTISNQIEVVISTPDPHAFRTLEQKETAFTSVKIIAVDQLEPLGILRAGAVHAATAPFVFLGETHSFAAVDNWAELLVSRHHEGWAVVVPGFRNANPKHLLSWAGFLLDYGNWQEETPAGEIEYWPLNNASCKRQALLDQGDSLTQDLSYGDQLILALRDAGHKVFLEPTAVLAHLNLSRAQPWFDERLVAGILIARYRSQQWSFTKRALYTLASPLIAFILFARVLGPTRQIIGSKKLSLRILPIMLAGTIVQSLGEMIGYSHLISDAPSERRMTEYEIHKAKYTSSRIPE